MKILFITNSDIGNTTYGGGKASAARFASEKELNSQIPLNKSDS